MAKPDVIKLLDDAAKAIDDDWARGQLKEFSTYLTLTSDDLANAMEQGFNAAMENRKSGNTATISKADFKAEALRQIPIVYNEYSNKKSDGVVPIRRGYNGKFLRVNMATEDKDFFGFIKELGVEFVNSRLEAESSTPLRGGKHEYNRRKRLSTKNPKKLTQRQEEEGRNWFESSSEIGKFKSGANIAHRGGSTVGSARGVAVMNYLKGGELKSFFGTGEWKSIFERFPDLELKYEVVEPIAYDKKGKVTKGKLGIKTNQQVIIDYVPTKANQSGTEIYDWGKPNGIKDTLQKSLIEWANRVDWKKKKSSNSIEEDAREIARLVALGAILKGKRRTNAKRKGVSRPKKSISHSGTGTPPGTPRSSGKKARPLKAQRGSSAGNQQGASLYTVMAMISEKLPQTVRKNMGAPRLENQTGTFANSVKMTDVIQTPQGYPSFGYTYAKEPYQVFETGSSGNWANPERDPRRLIDASIREIAAGFALGRFYTRRN